MDVYFGEDFEGINLDEVLYSALLGAVTSFALEGAPSLVSATLDAVRSAAKGAYNAVMGKPAEVYLTKRITEGKAESQYDIAAKSSGIGVQGKISDYPIAKQKTIKEYLSSVNKNLLNFIGEVKNSTDGKIKRHNISSVTDRQAEDIKNLIGVDVSGYTNAINSNAIQHIENRHGSNI